MTVHKAQGQTLGAVEVYCGREFAPGQLYLAISKVRKKPSVPDTILCKDKGVLKKSTWPSKV